MTRVIKLLVRIGKCVRSTFKATVSPQAYYYDFGHSHSVAYSQRKLNNTDHVLPFVGRVVTGLFSSRMLLAAADQHARVVRISHL